MDAEPPGDRHHALTVRSGGSNSFHLTVRQRCSSPSPWGRDDPRLDLDGTLGIVTTIEFRLLPRGTEPLEPLPGVRFESTRVHQNVVVQTDDVSGLRGTVAITV